jgi:DNA-binding CsgD family transcriptional regulator
LWEPDAVITALPLARDLAAIRDVTEALDTFRSDEPQGLPVVMAPIRELLRFDVAITYGVAAEADGFRLNFAEARGRVDVGAFRGVMGGFVGQQKAVFAGYNPARPEPWNRNRILAYPDLVRRGLTTRPIVELLRRLRLDAKQQLRVLVCDGPSLLGWVGGYRAEAYRRRDYQALAALVPAIQRRLRLERALAVSGTLRAALDVAMEVIGAAAYLADASGRVLHANTAGEAALDDANSNVRATIVEAVRSKRGHPALRVTRVAAPGCADHYLAVARVAANASQRAASAAARWELSPRQGEVLRWLVEGASNARIGAELGISDRTVEVHVAAIMTKAQCWSRAMIVGAVLGDA